jgi:hypothetical protein
MTTNKVVFTSKPKDYPKEETDFVIDSALSNECFGSFSKISRPYKGNKSHLIRVFHTMVDNFSNRWMFKYQKEMTLALALHSIECLHAFGCEVVCYSDIPEAKLLPYDEVYDFKGGNNEFWAGGKVSAFMEEYSKGYTPISIDTDVFIYKNKVMDKLGLDNNVVSHIEDTVKYKSSIDYYGTIVNERIGETLFNKEDPAYNVGILKLLDPTAYVLGYNNISHILRGASENNQSAEKSPDLIAEQVWLPKILNEPDFVTTQKEVDKLEKAKTGFHHGIAFDKFLKIREIVMKIKNQDLLYNLWNDMNFEIITV